MCRSRCRPRKPPCRSWRCQALRSAGNGAGPNRAERKLNPIQGPARHVQGPQMGPRGGAWFVFLPGLGNLHRIQLQSRVISLARTSFGMFIAIFRGRLSVYAKGYLTALNGSFSMQGQAHE